MDKYETRLKEILLDEAKEKTRKQELINLQEEITRLREGLEAAKKQLEMARYLISDYRYDEVEIEISAIDALLEKQG